LLGYWKNSYPGNAGQKSTFSGSSIQKSLLKLELKVVSENGPRM
jgi:hypothetical protein